MDEKTEIIIGTGIIRATQALHRAATLTCMVTDLLADEPTSPTMTRVLGLLDEVDRQIESGQQSLDSTGIRL